MPTLDGLKLLEILSEKKIHIPVICLTALTGDEVEVKAFEFGARIPIGLLYETQRPTYEDTEPVLSRGALVDQPLGLDRATFEEILAETM